MSSEECKLRWHSSGHHFVGLNDNLIHSLRSKQSDGLTLGHHTLLWRDATFSTISPPDTDFKTVPQF